MLSLAKDSPTLVRYCIIREDGMIVPLVRADTLPASVINVKPSLTAQEALDLNLKRVDKSSGAQVSTSSTLLSRAPSASPCIARPGGQFRDLSAIRAKIQAGGKVWCSKWLDNKECSFEQQGCKYLHTIPPRGLWTKLGFPHGRTWWRHEAPHMFKSHRAQLTGVLTRSPTISPVASTNIGRPRIPAVIGPLGNSDQAHYLQTLKNRSPSPITTLDAASEASYVKQLDDLIDLEDYYTDPPRSVPVPYASSSSDSEAPAAKKTKICNEPADAVVKQASPVRSFIPAGGNAKKHVAEARLYADKSHHHHHDHRGRRSGEGRANSAVKR